MLRKNYLTKRTNTALCVKEIKYIKVEIRAMFFKCGLERYTRIIGRGGGMKIELNQAIQNGTFGNFNFSEDYIN